MGLFWNDDASASEKQKSAAVEPTPSIPQSQSSLPSATPSADAPAPKVKKVLSRDEVADAELQEFLKEIAEADKPKKPKYKRMAVLPTDGPGASPTDPAMTLEDSLYPTTMSCREAFDSAFYCQSLGGQFNALYRYGGIQSCSDHWKSFWFCMRSKGLPEDQKKDTIRDHYKKKDLKYKLGPSSEDIWEGRDKKVEWGQAFNQSIEHVLAGESNAAWNERERKRREGRGGGTI